MIFRLSSKTPPKTSGTITRMIKDRPVSLRRHMTTPPKNISGMIKALPQNMETIQLRLPTSWVERVTRLDTPMRPSSSKVMVWTFANRSERSERVKPLVI